MKRRVILSAIVAVAVIFVAVWVFLIGVTPSTHYKKHHDGKSLYAVLYTEVQPGDTVERLEELLGPGEESPDPVRLRKAVAKFAEEMPEGYPDGYQETDTYLGYKTGPGGTLWIQFRDGKLVNFTRSQFKEYKTGDVIR